MKVVDLVKSNDRPLKHRRVVIQIWEVTEYMLSNFLFLDIMRKRILLFCIISLCFGGARADIFGDLLDFVFGGGCYA